MATPTTPFFPWSDDFSLKNQVIDGQHQQIVKLLGELHESVVNNELKTARVKILTHLYDSSKAHFAFEEQLLRLHRCPRYLLHKAAHEGLAHALKGLREEVVSGERKLTVEYVELIRLWLIDHFGEFDRAGASFLSDEPPKAANGADRPTAREP